jgi:hypothetical protein
MMQREEFIDVVSQCHCVFVGFSSFTHRLEQFRPRAR